MHQYRDDYNCDEQALVFKSDSGIEEFSSDDQLPLEYATDSCAVPPYIDSRLQNLMISDTHLSPQLSFVTALGFACPIGPMPLEDGSPRSPTAAGLDCRVVPSPDPCQSQWSEMSPGLTHETQAQPRILCGWSPDLEPPGPHSITNIPQSLPQMDTHSKSDAEQRDAWSQYYLGATVDACAFSPNGDAGTLSSTHETGAFPPYPQDQYQAQPGTLCGWSPDLEPFSVPNSMSNIPQSLLPMHTHSNSVAEQYDAYTRYFLGGTVETRSSSPHEHTALSASGTLRGVRALPNYDIPFNARADLQPSLSLTHNAISSIRPTALPYNEPICAPDGQTQTLECRWLTNGAPCGMRVVADRRNVIKHLRDHDIRPGEDKARQRCFWESCTMTLNKESLVRHILTVHLKEGVKCAECGLSFAREDSLKRHLKGGQHKAPSDKSTARQPVRNHVRSRRPEH